MPTNHRRINVTCDPELASALERSREALPGVGRSEAALLRRLALVGADALRAEGPDAARLKLLAIPGVIPRTADRRLPWLPSDEPPSDAGTRALEWVRGDR